MLNRIVRTVCTVVLGYTLALLPVVCADDKDKEPKAAKTPPAKAPDWSKYTTAGELVGEIVKADDKSLTLRVTGVVPQGGSRRRPPTGKQTHHDYVLEFVPESLVRTKSLPPKLDDRGKRVDYTPKELDALRLPSGVTGYAATTDHLVPGAIVEVITVRDRTIPAAKATENDLRVKYAIILSKEQNAPPPKDDKDAKKDDKTDAKKGKKDK